MAQLALDQRQRDPFVQQLDGVSMTQLVWRHPPPDPCLEREMVKLAAGRAG